MLLYVLVPQAEQAMGKIVADTGVDFLIGTTMMMCLSVLAARIVVGFPTAVKANWIFQITQLYSPVEYAKASQRALLTMGVVPAFLLSVLLIVWVGISWAIASHLCALALVGLILVNVAMLSLHKLPFACSWNPAKVNVLVTFFGGLIVGIPLTRLAAEFEMKLLRTTVGRVSMLAGLMLLVVASSWLMRGNTSSAQETVF